MKAEEARKLAKENSKKMQELYRIIEASAKRGNNNVAVHNGMASSAEIDVLQAMGYTCGYETSETDGGQFLVIYWK